MKRKRHRPEQVIVKLREAEAALSTGASIEQICKQLGDWPGDVPQVAQAIRRDESRRDEAAERLERENARLKKIVADLSIDNSILKEVAKGNF